MYRPARRLLPAVAACAIAALAAPAANAGVLVSSATSCDNPTVEHPFTSWGDIASYVLAPGGTLEGATAAWSLSAGVLTVAGNEPWYVHGAGESTSLFLNSGGSATTGSMCVGIEHPDVRFFARNNGSLTSTLQLEVLFEDASGNVHSLTIGQVAGGNGWDVTPIYPVVANLLPLLPGSHTAVAFRFTAQGGPWQIDDIYVDPWRKG
jgi:hypothetical protein